MKVFLSSTYEDLLAHRSTVEASFAISRIQYNAMEHFGSNPRPPIDTCLKAVRDSQAFVGVLGVCYGGCPPGCVLSYTEREFRQARADGKPIFMFLIDERNAHVAPTYLYSETQQQQARLQNFKKYVRRKFTVSVFTSPEDLSRLVLASLIREFGVII